VGEDDSIDIIKLIQSVRNFVQSVRATHKATSNHQTKQENERDDSLNHAIEMIENLLQEARQQIAANDDLADLVNHADHADHANHADHADHANHADYADHANYADHADHANHADHADYANHADHADHADQSQLATS
jgi:hypothetical protein